MPWTYDEAGVTYDQVGLYYNGIVPYVAETISESLTTSEYVVFGRYCPVSEQLGFADRYKEQTNANNHNWTDGSQLGTDDYPFLPHSHL